VIVCVCNNIREIDLKENPFLIDKVGRKCGICVLKGVIECDNTTYIVDRRDTEHSEQDYF